MVSEPYVDMLIMLVTVPLSGGSRTLMYGQW